MYKSEFILEDEMHKILWDHLIIARRPELALIEKEKKNWHLVHFAIPTDYRVKVKDSKNTQIL